jgi:hypothetical protein
MSGKCHHAMWRMYPSGIAILILSIAPAATHERPAVAKVLNLMQLLQATQQQHSYPVSFSLTESELNEYLTYSLRNIPRPGIQGITVKIFPSNYISTLTTVDFDAMEHWNPGTVPIVLRPVLSGRKAIWLDVRFQAKDGAVTFSVEKASFQGIRLPAFLVEKIIHVVAARQPEKYDTSKPLPLPFGLRKIYTSANVVAGGN